MKVAQLCPTLCDPVDYTVRGILQARILEWVAFPFFTGSSQSRDGTQVSCIAGGFFTSWATREARSLVYNYSNFYPYVLHNIYNSTNMHKLCIMCYILSCIYYLTMYFVRLSIFAQINLPRFPMRLHRTISFHWILLCGPTITYHCTYNEQYYNKHFCIYIFLYTCMCKFLEVAFLGKHVWIFKV